MAREQTSDSAEYGEDSASDESSASYYSSSSSSQDHDHDPGIPHASWIVNEWSSQQWQPEDDGKHTEQPTSLNTTTSYSNVNRVVNDKGSVNVTKPHKLPRKQSIGEYMRHQITLYNARRNSTSDEYREELEKVAEFADVLVDPFSAYTNLEQVSESTFDLLRSEGVLRRDISLELFNVAPEVFIKTPENFSRLTKSPCWFVGSSSGTGNRMLRCLPHFYLIGMPKCGTTDLYAKITQHPSVVKVWKEPHWWTRTRFGLGGQGGKPKRVYSYDEYLDHMKPLVDSMLEQQAYESLVAGDASASTMWFQAKGKKGLDSYGLPGVLREIQPRVRLIAILRDPVDRLYSDYLYFHRARISPWKFHDRVTNAMSVYVACAEKRAPHACLHASMKLPRVTLGLYSVMLARWLKVFPRDQLLILRLREWSADCTGLLPKIYAHLELEKLPKKAILTICGSKAENVNKKKKTPMLNATIQLLRDFYQPYNADLAALLRDKRFLWLD